MECGSGLQLVHDATALGTDLKRRVRHLLDDLEPVPAGVALVFAERHGILFQQVAAVFAQHTAEAARHPRRTREQVSR